MIPGRALPITTLARFLVVVFLGSGLAGCCTETEHLYPKIIEGGLYEEGKRVAPVVPNHILRWPRSTYDPYFRQGNQYYDLIYAITLDMVIVVRPMSKHMEYTILTRGNNEADRVEIGEGFYQRYGDRQLDGSARPLGEPSAYGAPQPMQPRARVPSAYGLGQSQGNLSVFNHFPPQSPPWNMEKRTSLGLVRKDLGGWGVTYYRPFSLLKSQRIERGSAPEYLSVFHDPEVEYVRYYLPMTVAGKEYVLDFTVGRDVRINENCNWSAPGMP